MVYLDSSLALAELLVEDRHPPAAFWAQELVTSGLTVYEVWCGLHRQRAPGHFYDKARGLLGRVFQLAFTPDTLARALEPFPRPLRTLDALHVASMDYLRTQGHRIEVATYDRRMADAARALGFPVLAP